MKPKRITKSAKIKGTSGWTPSEKAEKTNRDGFQNEDDVVARFLNWEKDELSQKWLKGMGYDLNEVEEVQACKITGTYKADVQIKVLVKQKHKREWDVQTCLPKKRLQPS